MLKVYFDGSGKDDLKSHYLTLAGFAGDKDSLDSLAREWLRVLDRHHPGLTFFHISEALAPDGYFRSDLGWTLAKVIRVATDLNGELAALPKRRFCGFRYTVNLVAYRKWRQIFELPSASRKCSQEAFGKVYEWYCGWSDTILSGPIELFYDSNEDFLKHVHGVWQHPARNKEFWSPVNRVESVVGRKTAAIQAADLLAWSANRIRMGPHDPTIDLLCTKVLREGAAIWNVDIEESEITGEYGRVLC